MTGAIEQLWYTRPPASAARNPGFQIVAASPGLADPGAMLTGMAMRLCRYDPPPRYVPPPTPVSYGWVDAGGFRFCFRRASAGTDELGRPGNLTAHILAGPPELLRAAELAMRFGSAWWWDGKVPDNRSLPALDSLDEVPRQPPTAPPQLADMLAAFVDAIIARRMRTLLWLRFTPAEIAALVLAVDQAVPGLMDAHGVSTYESPRTASWFDIVGAVEPIPGAVPVAARPSTRTPAVVTEARRLLLSTDRPRVVKTAARAAGIGTPKPLVASLPGLIAAYRDLDAGAAPSAQVLANSLASPTVAKLTLDEFPEVRAYVARELIREQGTVFSALAALARDGFGAETLAAIGAVTGGELVSHRVPVARWEAVLGRLTALDPQAGIGCRRELIEQAGAAPAVLSKIGVALRLDLLRQAAADALAESHPTVRELLGNLYGEWRTVADDLSLPARWRATALAGAMSDAVPPPPGQLAERLRSDPEVGGPLADLLGDAAPLRDAVLSVAAERQSSFLLAIAPALAGGSCDDMLGWYARRLPGPGERLAFMSAALQLGLPPHHGEDWAELVRSTIAAELSLQIESGLIPWPTARQEELLRRGDDQWSRTWTQVLALAGRDDPHVTQLRSAVTQAMRLPPPQDADALNCAVTFFVARRPKSGQFAKALPVLDGWSEDGVSVLVNACLLVLRAERDEVPALELGYCLIDLVARGEVDPRSGRGVPMSAEIRRLSRNIPGKCRDGLGYYAAKKGKRAQAWWNHETGIRLRW